MAIKKQIISSMTLILMISSSYALSDTENAAIKAKKSYDLSVKKEQARYYDYLSKSNSSDDVLTPTQIKVLNHLKHDQDQARYKKQPLKRIQQTIVYNNDNPPVIYIGKSQLSTITFVDNSGSPYPIQSLELSDNKAFGVSQRATGSLQVDDTKDDTKDNNRYSGYNSQETKPKAKKQTSKKSIPAYMLNSITVRGQTDFANGGVVVYLVGRQSAVHLVLVSSDEKYDYQTNLTVDGLTQESLSKMSYSGATYDRPSNQMIQFLNGTPPHGAITMNIDIANTQVWQLGKYFYIRTLSILQSPAYISMVTTANGFNLYKIGNSSHVLNLVNHGEIQTAMISNPININKDF